MSAVNDKGDQNFKRKLSKREKKELKKKEKLSRLKSDTNDENRPVAEKLYTGIFYILLISFRNELIKNYLKVPTFAII